MAVTVSDLLDFSNAKVFQFNVPKFKRFCQFTGGEILSEPWDLGDGVFVQGKVIDGGGVGVYGYGSFIHITLQSNSDAFIKVRTSAKRHGLRRWLYGLYEELHMCKIDFSTHKPYVGSRSEVPGDGIHTNTSNELSKFCTWKGDELQIVFEIVQLPKPERKVDIKNQEEITIGFVHAKVTQ